MTFDINWPHGHVTSDGRKARYLGTLADGHHIFELPMMGGVSDVTRTKQDGSQIWSGCDTIHNAPVPTIKKSFWVNVDENGRIGGPFAAKEAADEFASSDRLSCQEITLEVPA